MELIAYFTAGVGAGTSVEFVPVRPLWGAGTSVEFVPMRALWGVGTIVGFVPVRGLLGEGTIVGFVSVRGLLGIGTSAEFVPVRGLWSAVDVANVLFAILFEGWGLLWLEGPSEEEAGEEEAGNFIERIALSMPGGAVLIRCNERTRHIDDLECTYE
jgi:hypothetical protein